MFGGKEWPVSAKILTADITDYIFVRVESNHSLLFWLAHCWQPHFMQPSLKWSSLWCWHFGQSIIIPLDQLALVSNVCRTYDSAKLQILPLGSVLFSYDHRL